jgi:acyl-CoA synthetase (AMP-forming)/AMP-acid ligase II
MERPSTFLDQPTPRIYRSTIPSIPVNDGSVYTLLFQDVPPVKAEGFYAYPTDRAAFIDAATGDSVSRGELKELTLKLGYGLRNHAVLPSVSGGANRRALSRGDVVMIFSPNSLSWPVMLFG